MAKFVQVLLLFFLLDVGVNSVLSLGGFNRCQLVPVDKKGAHEIYSEGEKIHLCCHMYSALCDGNMFIYHKPFENQNETLVMESEKCTIRLQISDAKTSNSGVYTCLVNEESIGIKEVYVVGKPRTSMRILKKKIIIKRESSSFKITFDPGDMTVFDNITLYKEIDNRDREIGCINSSLSCSNRICICKYQSGSPVFRDRDMTIVIVKVRLNNSIEVKDSFNPYFFIQPKHVVRLNSTDVTSSSANITWCQHSQMRNIIPYMNSLNASYGYKFEMFKRQGVWQKRTVTIPSLHKNFAVGEDKCIVVEVKDLIPFTNYDVKITAKTSQSKSRAEETSFTTKRDVPRTSPKEILFWTVDDLSSLKQDHKSPSQKSVALFLIWQPIPHDDKGGPIFYDVEIFGDGTKLSFQNNVNTSHTIVQNISLDKDLVIKIWAVNSISRSTKFSELRIPPYGIVVDAAGLEAHVDLQKESAIVHVKLPPGWEVSGIHWCPGHQYHQMDRLVMCNEFPLVDESVRHSEHDNAILKHTVDLRQNTGIFNDSIWEEKVVVKRYRNPKLVNPRNTQELNVIVKEHHISPSLHEWNRQPLKFFLSFMKDGQRMMQLFPFNCYYNSSKDEVKLLPRTYSEDNQMFLVLEQQCDFIHSSQYFVEEFSVVFAKSRQCKSVKGSTTVSLKNNIFDQNKVSVPQLPIYACITSEGSRYQNAHDVHFVEESPDEFDMGTIWTVLISIASVILLWGLCAGCICYYSKRYKKMKKGSKGTGATLIRIADNTFQEQDLIMTEFDSVSDIPECFERDSGFTASSHLISVTNSDTSRPFSELHKSDSEDNVIAQPAKSFKLLLTDEICSEEVNSETNTSQERSTGDETPHNLSDQESTSEFQSFAVEDLTNQLRLKCPE